MSGPKGTLKAQHKTPAIDDESQDSQHILDVYMQQYGISSVGHVYRAPPAMKKQCLGLESNQEQSPIPGVEARDATAQDQKLSGNPSLDICRSVNGTVNEKAVNERRSSGQLASSSRGLFIDGGVSVGATNTEHPKSYNARMDYPESPTQSNGSRNYEQYMGGSYSEERNLIASDSLEQRPQSPSETTFHEPRSLKDDDTGAVNFNFDHMAGTRTVESPTSEGPGLDDLGSLPSQDPPRQHQFLQPPETPAPPQNPFSKNRTQLLATSQLFKATQFSSAVRPQISPTSSRPSPIYFPNNSISPNPLFSPLKARGSPATILAPSSSPQVPPRTISPIPEDEQGPPSDTAYAEGTTTALNSHQHGAPRIRPTQEPMGVYVSMQKSQERRSISAVMPEPGSPGSSMDDDDDIDRRRRARYRKEAASKQLTSISFRRQPRSENVEVPSTSRKRRCLRNQTREYHKQGDDDGEETSSDLETQDKVEDSQTRAEPQGKDSSSQAPRPTQSARRNKEVQGIEKAISTSSIPSLPPASYRSANAHTLTRRSTDIDLSNGEAIPETSPIDKRNLRSSNMGRKMSNAVPESSNPASTNADEEGGQAPHEILFEPSLSAGSPVTRPSVLKLAKGRCLGLPRLASSTPCEEEGAEATGSLGNSPAGLPALNGEQSPDLAPSPPTFSTRIEERRSGASRVAVRDVELSSPPPAAPPESTSSLTSLNSTPSLPASTTPGTPASPSSGRVPSPGEDLHDSSPAVAKNRRRRQLRPLAKLKIAPEEPFGTSGRHSRRQQSCSTDELAQSPMSPTFEQSLRNPRISASRVARPSVKGQPAQRDQNYRGTKVFEGTAFAISFQSKKHGESADQYSDRMKQAKTLEMKIIQAGGRILDGGFDELFECVPVKNAATDGPVSPSQPDMEIKLAPNARSLGFTALIADGHSRKVKYMQALALGLPCIASRWVTTCLDRNELVDWSPYLLCAGQSAYLGDAIRSRNLTSYPASSASLAHIVERRPRLLAGSRILLVMKKSEEGKKMAYIFLARALGASLSRVYSLEEARTQLRAAEDVSNPFDWVYVDEKAGKRSLFSGAAPATGTEEGGKKRKRGGRVALPGPPPKRIRTLSDELVIQSLILGRLIEEGEMEE